MQRVGISILTILLLALFPAVSVRATDTAFTDIAVKFASAHSPNLVVMFHEVGRGDTTNYQATANATAVYACLHDGSATVTGSISVPFSFSNKGQGTESVTLQPPPLDQPICSVSLGPVNLVSVTYTNVMVTDTTNNVQSPVLPGPFQFPAP